LKMAVPSLPAADAVDMVGAESEFRDVPGLGDDEYPGFPADICPEELPDLSRHHSGLADVLKKDPGLYRLLKDRRTSLGVGLAKCIKTGIDNRGHPMIKTAGVVAGDEECYETFKELFEHILVQRHSSSALASKHVTDLDRSHLTSTRADPTGAYVLSAQIRMARSLQGIRFPPAATRDERREVERVVARALLEMEGSLEGEYHPLASSWSFAPKPGGMTPAQEETLRSANLIFEQPDSTTALCSGIGRHWPDARGVFVNRSQTFSVWVNEEEHIRTIAARQGDDVQGAFCEMADALDGMRDSFKRHGDCTDGFAFSPTLGFLTSCPASIGTSMRVSVIVNLPLLSKQQGLSKWCVDRQLSVRSAVDESGSQLTGMFEVSNSDRLGLSEVGTVNLVVESVSELVHAEIRLSSGLAAGLSSSLTTPAASSPQQPQVAIDKMPAADGPPIEDDPELAQAALKIQAVQRGKKDRQEVTQLRGEKDEAARQAAEAKQACELAAQDPELSQAAVKIQAIQRGKQDRKEVEMRKATNEATRLAATAVEAEVPLQSQNDVLGANAEEDPELSQAASKIQAIQRGNKERQEVQQIRKEKEGAVVKMQAAQRGKKDRKEVEKMREEKNNVAGVASSAPLSKVEDLRLKAGELFIRAHQSGDLASVIATLQDTAVVEPKLAAVDIEKMRLQMRENLLTLSESGKLEQALESLIAKDQAAKDPELAQAAVKIQAVHRGKSERKEVEQKRKEKEEAIETESAVVKIQAVHRGKADRKEVEQKRKEKQEAIETESAAVKIQAVHRGKADRKELEQKRKEKEEAIETESAAVKIQAVHRGKADRKELEQKRKEKQEAIETESAAVKIQAVHRGKKERREVQQKSREKVEASTIKTASGVPTAEELEAVRVKTRELLECAFQSGALHSALGSVQDEDLKVMRLRARQVLENASASGELEAAFTKLQTQNLERTRLKMREMLSDACDSGALSTAFAKMQQPKAEYLEDIRLKMKDMLNDACDSGALGSALDNMKKLPTESVEQKAEYMEDIRLKMKLMLNDACDSGALTSALDNMRKPPTESMDDMHLRMKDMLITACDSGSLAQALQTIRRESPPENMEDMRLRLKATIESACDSGHLADALLNLRQPVSANSELDIVKAKAAELEIVKAKAAEAFSRALEEEDEVKALIAPIPAADEIVGAPLDEDVDIIKADMRAKLNAACMSGDLAHVLNTSAPSAQLALAPAPSSSSGALVSRNLLDDFVAAGDLKTRAIGPGPAALLLQAISNSNRRAGALKVLIKETEKRSCEQDEVSARLEAEIATIRRETEHLRLDSESQMRALEGQETTNFKLQDSQRRLYEDLDDGALKQRHRMLDITASQDPNIISARSDISTVCTMRDLTSPSPLASGRGLVPSKGFPFSSFDEAHEARPITAPPTMARLR